MESHTYERAQHESPEDQLSADVAGLIAEAAKKSERLGKPVDPIDCTKRATDIGDYLEALRREVFTKQQSKAVEIYSRLATFKANYDSDAALQKKIEWQEIEDRLLANNGHYLALALEMEQGGVLFGVDKDGNPLIADGGDEPIMKGMNYKNTRDRVLYKHDRYDRDGQIQRDKADQPVPTGYEMFPYVHDHDKSPEITDYESPIGKLFIKSPNGCEGRGSWVESGENPSFPRRVNFNPLNGRTDVFPVSPRGDRVRGVRRLLRVSKKLSI